MSTVPDEGECLRLLQGEGTHPRVIAHCRTVKALAVAMARMAGADVALVTAGALLHDLGRSRSHRIDHAVVGHRLARERGVPEEVVQIIKRHIGAGILPDEAEEMGLPRDDYMPRTLEEKVVAHADNLTADDRYVDHGSVMRKYLRKGLPGQASRVEALHAELSALCGRDVDAIAEELEGLRAGNGRTGR